MAIEQMIVDALLIADPHLDIANRIFEPENFLHLTDAIMPFIEATSDPVTNLSLPASCMIDSYFLSETCTSSCHI